MRNEPKSMENVEHLPRPTIEDAIAAGRNCAVCGVDALHVVHLDHLPDYVKCDNCSSAFVLSMVSDKAMYGSIPASYPATREVALKRWIELEAVDATAKSERSGEDRSPTPPFGIKTDGDASLAEEPSIPSTPPVEAPTPPFGVGQLDEFVPQPASEDNHSDQGPGPTLADKAAVAEPKPGRRFVVTLDSETGTLPAELCAHCLRQPAPHEMIARGQTAKYAVPLCPECQTRSRAKSEEQKSARLVAHLSSILVAGLLMVGALAIGLVDTQPIAATDILLLATVGIIGYALPAIFLVGRTSRVPPSPDAEFVRSTLQIHPLEDGVGFGWRNRGYAERFSSANVDRRVGELSREDTREVLHDS